MQHNLWDTTMDPDQRTLLQVELEDTITADETFQQLMGDEVATTSRNFIEENANMLKTIDT